MNIKNLCLPIALSTATLLGGTTLINKQNNEKIDKTEVNIIKPAQISEKDVFNYLKHTSNPLELPLCAGIFGIGIAAKQRKEDALLMLDEIESYATDNKNNSIEIGDDFFQQCKNLRRLFNKNELNSDDEENLKYALFTLARVITVNASYDENWEYRLGMLDIINESLDINQNQDNEKTKDECKEALDNIIKNLPLYTIDSSPENSHEIMSNIKTLRGIINTYTSDYPDLRNEIIDLLNYYESLFCSIYSKGEENTVQIYQMIPKLTYLIEKYTTPESDWNKNPARHRYPTLEKYNINDDYLNFANNTLENCKKIRLQISHNTSKDIPLLVNIIKTDMLKHGTYDELAFGNAMMYMDAILSNSNPAGGKYYGSFSKLTFYIKNLLEDIYTSVHNPEYNRPYGTAPNTFEEWLEEDRLGTNKRNLFRKQAQEFVNTEDKNNKLDEVVSTSVNIEKKVNKSKKGKITFSSVGGQDKAIEILKKKVLYPIKYPNAFKNRMLSHGIIMHGRPGTGKTLLALALSNEADANFIKINASELTSKFHGESDQNWRDLFAKAREEQPCIIFIDEFDTVAQKRGHNSTNNYDDTVINTILAEMSDVEKDGDNIFLIGATNRFEVLDSGITRAGRFGTHIELKAPETVKDVIQIFDIHTKDKNLSTDLDKNKLAEMMLAKNVTGSDIASIIDEALENTFMRLGIYEKMDNNTFNDNDINDIEISMDDFVNAIMNYDVSDQSSTQRKRVTGFNAR